MPIMEQNYNVPNLERAIDIIEFFSRNDKEYTITEISKELDFPRNSVFRIMKTLQNRGLVTDFSGKTYQLTPKLLAIGYSAVTEQNLLHKATPYLYQLRDELHESVFLGIIRGTTGAVIEEALSDQIVKVTLGVGTQFPVHSSAPGKAILAYLDEYNQEKILNEINYTSYTSTTIDSKEKMQKEIELIRRYGWAADREEYAVGIKCVACPVFNYQSQPIAAIWMGGQASSVNWDNCQSTVDTVLRYAKKISIRCGYPDRD
jgi:DNA-binding IclR family transcriptional regulator